MLYMVCEGNLSENIKKVSVKNSATDAAELAFDLTCTNCRETHDSPVIINCVEKHEMPGSKGEASFVLKCKFCGKDCSVNIEAFENALYNGDVEVNSDDIDKVKTQRKKRGLKSAKDTQAALFEFDCRGCELVTFHPSSVIFIVKLLSGNTLECQLEEGENEWYDYDDNDGEEVSITDFKFDIIKGK